MRPRFYVPDLDADRSTCTLPADEARHLTRVLRLAAGDEVLVFDGRGAQYGATVEVAVRETVSLRLGDRVPAPALPVRIVVGQAVLKGAGMDDAVRDATMMGAGVIQPLLTAHTDVKVAVARRPEAVERWRRVALAAVKQSRRATLPVVEAPCAFDEWIARPAGAVRLFFVEPSAGGAPQALRSVLGTAPPDSAAIALGPEGGWGADEIERAVRHGWTPVTLGPLTLRAESMPVAALAALSAWWSG